MAFQLVHPPGTSRVISFGTLLHLSGSRPLERGREPKRLAWNGDHVELVEGQSRRAKRRHLVGKSCQAKPADPVKGVLEIAIFGNYKLCILPGEQVIRSVQFGVNLCFAYAT